MDLVLHPNGRESQAIQVLPARHIGLLGLDYRGCLCIDIHIGIAPVVSLYSGPDGWECTEVSGFWRAMTWCCSSYPL